MAARAKSSCPAGQDSVSLVACCRPVKPNASGFRPDSPPETVGPQAGCKLRPVTHRKGPSTRDCDRPGRHRCRSLSWSRHRFRRRLFLGNRLFVDCFFLFSRLFSRLFFGCLAGCRPAYSRFPSGCLLLCNHFLFLHGFLSRLLLCSSLLGSCHVRLRKKVAQMHRTDKVQQPPHSNRVNPPEAADYRAPRYCVRFVPAARGVTAVLNARPLRPCSPDHGIRLPDRG